MRDHESGLGIKVKDALVNMAFPRRCPVCDEIVPVGDGMICSPCMTKPQYITEPRAGGVGNSSWGNKGQYSPGQFCHDCMNRKHAFDYGYALYDYQSMRRSIYRFKYGKRCEYADFYTKDICEKLSDEICLMGADCIIPVPVHASRLRAGGTTRRSLLPGMSGLTGIPMDKKLVKRVRKTVPQKELTIQERQNNLKKAFHISANVVKLNKVILVDDIYTTGSTFDAIAMELKRRGVKSVYFIALCIGEGM